MSVNAKEIDEIQRKADKAGMSRSRYMREVALGYHVRAKDITLTPELIKLNAQLGRIGSNLNQIARRANRDGTTGPWLQQAKATLDEVETIIDKTSDIILGD